MLYEVITVEIIDRSKQDEEYGIKRIVLTNDSSKDKRPDLMTDEGQQVLSKELNDIFNVFVDSILEKRSNKLSKEKIESFKGRVFISSESLENGLIDKEMIESELYEYLTDSISLESPSFYGDKNIKMEAKMDLADLLKDNPEAQKQHDDIVKARVDEAITAERDRGSKLLSIGGKTVSDSLKKAYAEGMSAGDFAIAEIKNRDEKIVKTPSDNLGNLTNVEQTPKSAEVNKDGKDSYDDFLDSFYGKKENK